MINTFLIELPINEYQLSISNEKQSPTYLLIKKQKGVISQKNSPNFDVKPGTLSG